MRELHSYATNTLALVRDGKIEPQAEIALVLSEIEYLVGAEGKAIRERVPTMVRFVASPAALRTLAEKLIATAEQVETELAEAMVQALKAVVQRGEKSQEKTP